MLPALSCGTTTQHQSLGSQGPLTHLPNDSFLTLLSHPKDAETLPVLARLLPLLSLRKAEPGKGAGPWGSPGWGCGERSQAWRELKPSPQLVGLGTQLMGGWQRQIVVYF